jgi:HPt (histidine-containing phosphotransfer) domain-containing protein
MMDGLLPQQSAMATFLAYLERQREEYRYAIPARLADIDALWSAIVRSGPSSAKLLELERHAHNLAGSGATFNFRRLSEAAKALELAVQEKRERGTGLNHDEQLRVAYAINELHRAAA